MPQKTRVEIDSTGAAWSGIMDAMIAHSAHIVVLHGAGSFNGISIADADRLLTWQLIPRMKAYLAHGKVTAIYDGDNDDPAYPDIGHIMGRLREHFDGRVDFYAVQMLGWYRYRDQLPNLRPLHSANGKEYSTILFPDNTFKGDHDYFSQHERLALAPAYEQWYVGACGEIARRQLDDFNSKAQNAAHYGKACIFRAPVSKEQEQKIRRKLATSADAAQRKRLETSLIRRAENPYGLLCSNSGEFILLPEYDNLTIEIV